MRYVVEFDVGDGYTWWAVNVEPIIFDGDPEDIQIAFMIAMTEATDKVEFGGNKFDSRDFHAFDCNDMKFYNPPRFYTVDEWFAKVEK